jgi:hypothetical protein
LCRVLELDNRFKIQIGSYLELLNKEVVRVLDIAPPDLTVQVLAKAEELDSLFGTHDTALEACYDGRQVWWTNIVRTEHIDCVINLALVFPIEAVGPCGQEHASSYIASGGIVFSQEGVALSVTDHVEYVWSQTQETLVSPIHFLPPQYLSDPLIPIRKAFDLLLVSVARARFGQITKSMRRVDITAGCLKEAFQAAALAEPRLGVAVVTIDGARFKMWFDTADDLATVLGDVIFESKYGLGTPFILQPPFGIMYQPCTGRAWVRCAPEVFNPPDVLDGAGGEVPEADEGEFIELEAFVSNY